MVVAFAVAVVRLALELAVELAGRTVRGVRNDVIDVALVGGHVAAAVVPAVAVADFDGSPEGAGEAASVRHRDHRRRAVEQYGLEVGVAGPLDELAGGDHRAVGELAHLGQRGVADQHGEQRLRAPTAGRSRGRTFRHLDQRSCPPL